MADEQHHSTPQAMTDADIAPATAGDSLVADPAAPGDAPAGGIAAARNTIRDNGAKVRAQAEDKARVYAEDGKAKATSALGQLSTLLNDAAGQVDEKLGEQYGQYARTAAEKVQTFSSSLESKSVDDLVSDAREMVRKSPAIAVGAAAAVGFVVARLLTSGLDQRDA